MYALYFFNNKRRTYTELHGAYTEKQRELKWMQRKS